MSKYKGSVIALAFLAVIAAIILGAALIFFYFTFLQKLLVINSGIDVLVSSGDIGSGLSSLLEAKKGPVNNAEIIGTLDGKADDGALAATLGKMQKSLSVYDGSGTRIWSHGNQSSGLYTDVALTGGRKGRAGLS
ncbi:MAG: hypothetical protein HY367_01110 [Candidatus Aenigmarchaeota archaeon]|nr:hypothetical protein [Candidatus Aenigmarchaeota archaeon]